MNPSGHGAGKGGETYLFGLGAKYRSQAWSGSDPRAQASPVSGRPWGQAQGSRGRISSQLFGQG